MKYILIISIILTTILSKVPAEADSNSPSRYPQKTYLPYHYNPFQQYPKVKHQELILNSFNVWWSVEYFEPMYGYPYHTGLTIQVYDTIKVFVNLNNQSASDFDMLTQNIEDWFYPVIYDPAVDVFNNKPLADTNAFSYRFEHWITNLERVICDKPDTIRAQSSFSFVINIWGVYPGKYRVVLKAKEGLPENVNLLMRSGDEVYSMSRAMNKGDSINSYKLIATNALRRREFTLSNTYIDSIFYLNPLAIPGWEQRQSLKFAQNDIAGTLQCIDSLLYIVENNLDPMIPDSVKRTAAHRTWLDDIHANFTWIKWRLTNPDPDYILTD